jgi:hypothetical protein
MSEVVCSLIPMTAGARGRMGEGNRRGPDERRASWEGKISQGLEGNDEIGAYFRTTDGRI